MDKRIVLRKEKRIAKAGWNKKGKEYLIYIMKCLNCGKEFEKKGGRYKQGQGKYCSYSCSAKQTLKPYIGKNKPMLGKVGKDTGHWKGGKYKDSGGYVLIYSPSHPYTIKGKYVFEHRLVMEKYLGRYLTLKEVIHHLNGIRDDNRIENLELTNKHAYHMAKYHNIPRDDKQRFISLK